MGLHGWVGAEDTVLQKYAAACLRASEDDDAFSRFKQDPDYRPILEGGPRLFFDTYLEDIRNHNNANVFFENLETFRINDSVGEPDLFEEPDIGKFSGTTIKFAHNAIDILEFIKDHGNWEKTKNIVEIGGGYGGLCLILSGFIDFDTYTHVDIPEACKLVEKYTSQFPQLEGKVKTFPCNQLDQFYRGPKTVDLTIGINSINECTRDTQLDYFNKIVANSKLSYIIRNPDTAERWEDHKATIDALGDTFLVDDSGRAEAAYSRQIVVYIKNL